MPQRLPPALSCFVLLALAACGGRTEARSPAAARAAEVVALINSGDRAAARDYIDESYATSFRDVAPTAQHLGILSDLHTQRKGLRIERVAEPKPGTAEVLTRSDVTQDWLTIAVEVEPTPPHRITGMMFQPAEAPAGRAAPAPRTDQERIQALEEFVRRQAEADAFSGVVMLAKDGRPLFAAAYGEANKEARRKNGLETAFNLASMNKMITAVAVAQLVEAGKLSFDDPLSKFLPDFPNPRAAREIRIGQLLSHTAGLGSYLGPGISNSRAATVDEMLRYARDSEPAFTPGSRWDYSNTGFLVLGKVIEKASGESYYDYVRRHILAPAGMRSTDWYAKDRIPPMAAIGYDREYERGPGAYTSHLADLPYRGGPAGGGYSTAPDVLRFAEAFRTGKLVSPAMVRVLTTPKPASPEYGYGFTVDAKRGIVGHSGGFQGTSTNMDLFLEDGYTAIVLSNYGRSGMSIVDRMRELVRGPVAAAPGER
jgi:CubicO group peptidase (beta-lactamase class C family)